MKPTLSVGRALCGAAGILILVLALSVATILLARPHSYPPSAALAQAGSGHGEGGKDADGPGRDPGLPEDTSAFHGVNWADPRDNFASDELVPTGLDTSMSYDEVRDTAGWVIRDFASELDADTVRLPINPPTVDADWWDSYRAAIDEAREQGFTVILSYWESDDEADGQIDDEAAFTDMWDTVVEAYRDDDGVLFEPMNEPHGYEPEDWVQVATDWVQRHEDQVPRARMIISGSGYNDDVTTVGAAEELDGTLLSLHHYGYWNEYTDQEDWREDISPRLGDLAERTLITEAGSPMTIGLNYGNPDGDVSTAYLNALTGMARENHMGIVYWPGLRESDSYSMTRVGDDDRSLEVTDPQGLQLLQWGWGITDQKPENDDPPAPAGKPLRSSLRDQCLDVSEGSSEPGAAVTLYDCNGGPNQSWNTRRDGTITVYGDMCLSRATDASAGSEGALVIQDCDGGEDQQWDVADDGRISPAGTPGMVLATQKADEGFAVVLDSSGGGADETWQSD
jgi:hypothetical protein